MDSGTFIEHEGKPAVRFQRTYAHPVDRLWAAITEPEDLAHWFPSKVALESRIGGTVAFSGDPNIKNDHGTVLAYDPPRKLAYTWGGDELHFELEPVAEGCALTLINVLEARDGAARNAAGWAVCLAELDKHVDGGVANGPHSDSAEAWQPLYDGFVAAGMPSGAPIPGK